MTRFIWNKIEYLGWRRQQFDGVDAPDVSLFSIHFESISMVYFAIGDFQ